MLKRWLMIFSVAIAATPAVAAAQVSVHFEVPEVRVRIAPPAARVEVQPARPSPQDQWVAGHWAWRDNSNQWVAGAWSRPPGDGMVWQDARWNQRNGSWYYGEGYWRWANPATPNEVYDPPAQQAPVVIDSRPPRNFDERRPPRPFRNAVWINGYWSWNGSQHMWVAGRWSAPRAHSVWTPDRWTRDQRRGQEGRWVLARGHWRSRR